MRWTPTCRRRWAELDWHGIAVFAIAYALVVISPGPGLASFVGQSLGHGIKAAPAQALAHLAVVWSLPSPAGMSQTRARSA